MLSCCRQRRLHRLSKHARIWLTASLLRWPGVTADGRFRLYHSAKGSVAAAAGTPVVGADGAFNLEMFHAELPQAIAERYRHVAAGPTLQIPADASALRQLHRGQLVLVQEDANGQVLQATRVQVPGALDDLYATAVDAPLGVAVAPDRTSFRLWAPTARNVAACLHPSGSGPASSLVSLQRDDATGVWSTTLVGNRSGSYYTYLVDVHVDGAGMVRNLVADPYAISLTTDSRRAYVADLKLTQPASRRLA